MHTNVVGIVIVSYNASLAVRITLASLRQSKNRTPYKMILVDNASKEEERTIIKQAFDKHTAEESLPWEYIQVKKNLGFSGGNNVGIRKFMKDPSISYICLLNSDVIVPDFWLDRLVEKGRDAVSAVTNKAYSEQCVPAEYNLDFPDCFDLAAERVPETAFTTINAFAQSWNKAWQGNLVHNEVTFFCVLLKRELVKKIGLLDEKFFPGGYEDDDYCARILAAGGDIFLARDVYIHHFGSASFGQLQQQYFNEKASRNRLYLEKKHKFTFRRRPEKPVTSYMQDIMYALKGLGNADLQRQYNQLYIDTLTGLINHNQNEFTAIQGHLMHSGQTPPEDLRKMVEEANSFGNITDRWNEVTAAIGNALQSLPCDPAELSCIEQNLKDVASAVYAKAEANTAMVAFLIETGVFSAGPSKEKKSPLKKIGWLFTKGIPFIWKVKGIVFFGGYPYPEREKDGYFQRIRFIDNLFPDRWRIYVDHGRIPGRDSWYDRPAPKVVVLNVNNHKHAWFVRLIVKLCVLKCRTIYFHSVLRMEDSKFGSLMRWPFIKKLIDIHGVVPEEFRMHNDFFSAVLYEGHERLAVRKAGHILVVTHAMHRYFQHKYRQELDGAQVIVLPIFPNVEPVRHAKPYVDGKPIVVYAGGTHKWQQVPKMIDAMNATKDFCVHKFFCPQPSEVLEMMPESLRHHPSITIDSKPFSELLKIYPECHYGFILREDIIVNNAACPTKLVEYVAMGIVPIVDCEDMGDFKTLGMQFITLKDLLAGNLPDEAARHAMAETNYGVYNKLQELNQKGTRTLQQALGYKGGSLMQMARGGKEMAKKLLPKDSPQGRIARRMWWAARDYRGSVMTKRKQAIEVANGTAVAPSLAPCQVLLQVDNFLVGGLENVVLDQIDVFRREGLKVSLLILGEAGGAAERARKSGVPMCVTPFEAETYERLIAKAAPKVVITHYSINGASICHKLGIPFLQVIQNTYMWFSDEQAHQFAKAARHTETFVAVSEYAKEYSLARLGVPADKCLVIPNSINMDSFRKVNRREARTEIRRKHGLSEEDFVFLSVGSINHQKNHICSVRAFHQALPECPGAKLVILGKLYEHGLWNEIQEYITANGLEKDVIYAGESPNPPAYYAMADSFVLSSFFEGGPLSMLEGIASGLPLVVTDIGFAEHFKGIKGIEVVPPPVWIIDYRGPIWELASTPECERTFGRHMVKVYKERIKPDIPQKIVDMFDKQYTYQMYTRLVRHIIRHGSVAQFVQEKSWPDLMKEKELSR